MTPETSDHVLIVDFNVTEVEDGQEINKCTLRLTGDFDYTRTVSGIAEVLGADENDEAPDYKARYELARRDNADLGIETDRLSLILRQVHDLVAPESHRDDGW